MAHFKLQAGSVMASPNIIPMADIMLVLLIIFMVVTPMFQPGPPMDMARVKDPIEMPDANRDDAVIVAIARDGSTFLGNTKMPLDEISSRVRDRIASRLDGLHQERRPRKVLRFGQGSGRSTNRWRGRSRATDGEI